MKTVRHMAAAAVILMAPVGAFSQDANPQQFQVQAFSNRIMQELQYGLNCDAERLTMRAKITELEAKLAALEKPKDAPAAPKQ